eukprot:Opistho-2@13862
MVSGKLASKSDANPPFAPNGSSDLNGSLLNTLAGAADAACAVDDVAGFELKGSSANGSAAGVDLNEPEPADRTESARPTAGAPPNGSDPNAAAALPPPANGSALLNGSSPPLPKGSLDLAPTAGEAAKGSSEAALNGSSFPLKGSAVWKGSSFALNGSLLAALNGSFALNGSSAGALNGSAALKTSSPFLDDTKGSSRKGSDFENGSVRTDAVEKRGGVAIPELGANTSSSELIEALATAVIAAGVDCCSSCWRASATCSIFWRTASISACACCCCLCSASRSRRPLSRSARNLDSSSRSASSSALVRRTLSSCCRIDCCCCSIRAFSELISAVSASNCSRTAVSCLSKLAFSCSTSVSRRCASSFFVCSAVSSVVANSTFAFMSAVSSFTCATCCSRSAVSFSATSLSFEIVSISLLTSSSSLIALKSPPPTSDDGAGGLSLRMSAMRVCVDGRFTAAVAADCDTSGLIAGAPLLAGAMPPSRDARVTPPTRDAAAGFDRKYGGIISGVRAAGGSWPLLSLPVMRYIASANDSALRRPARSTSARDQMCARMFPGRPDLRKISRASLPESHPSLSLSASRKNASNPCFSASVTTHAVDFTAGAAATGRAAMPEMDAADDRADDGRDDGVDDRRFDGGRSDAGSAGGGFRPARAACVRCIATANSSASS